MLRSKKHINKFQKAYKLNKQYLTLDKEGVMYRKK